MTCIGIELDDSALDSVSGGDGWFNNSYKIEGYTTSDNYMPTLEKMAAATKKVYEEEAAKNGTKPMPAPQPAPKK